MARRLWKAVRTAFSKLFSSFQNAFQSITSVFTSKEDTPVETPSTDEEVASLVVANECMEDRSVISITDVPHGIRNDGFQCYMIACMQSFLSCSHFVALMNELRVSNNPAIKVSHDFCLSYYSDDENLSVTSLMSTLNLELCKQDDPCEALNRLGQLFGTLFRYKTKILMKCTGCNDNRERFNGGDCIAIYPPLDSDETPNLLTCLEIQFGEPTHVSFHCPVCEHIIGPEYENQCKKSAFSERTTFLDPLPDVLIFNIMIYGNDMKRMQQPMEMPEIIDMSPFLENKKTDKSTFYVLKSTIYHENLSNTSPGRSGHYTAVVAREEELYFCDDHRIRVEEMGRNGANDFPYVVFYERIDIE